MTIHKNDNLTRHPTNPAIPSPSRPAFLDSSLRWNDDGDGNGFVAIPTAPLLFLANYLTSTSVIYGQDVLYAARGQEARSRPAKAGIQWFTQAIPAQRE